MLGGLLREHDVLAPHRRAVQRAVYPLKGERLLLGQRHFLAEKSLKVRHFARKLREIDLCEHLIRQHDGFLFVNFRLVGRHGDEQVLFPYLSLRAVSGHGLTARHAALAGRTARGTALALDDLYFHGVRLDLPSVHHDDGAGDSVRTGFPGRQDVSESGRTSARHLAVDHLVTAESGDGRPVQHFKARKDRRGYVADVRRIDRIFQFECLTRGHRRGRHAGCHLDGGADTESSAYKQQ